MLADTGEVNIVSVRVATICLAADTLFLNFISVIVKLPFFSSFGLLFCCDW